MKTIPCYLNTSEFLLIKQSIHPLLHFFIYLPLYLLYITRNASVVREVMGLILRPIIHHSQWRNFYCYVRWATLIICVRGMSFPKTGALITMLGLSDSQRFGCLQWLGSRVVLGSDKQFGPRLLSTVTWGMIHNYLTIYHLVMIAKESRKTVRNWLTTLTFNVCPCIPCY